ncbi:MAG: transposase [Caldilineaceae bacterium SB0665_bin_25]|nr:transposase [Caldilineaceae bacterium SB0665_bin_25]
MFRKRIADHQWQKLYTFLQGHPRAYAGQEEKCRRFVEAVHWILHTGAQWRELPESYGKWNSVFKYSALAQTKCQRALHCRELFKLALGI